jgi:DNA-binding PadR family transcriptional regulator
MIDKFDKTKKDWIMGILTLKEEMILSALMMLGGSSRGAPVRKMVVELSRKDIVYGTLYNLLENCIRKGYVVSEKSDPEPVQGGRSKTIYTITAEGKEALHKTLAIHENIRKRIPGMELGG